MPFNTEDLETLCALIGRAMRADQRSRDFLTSKTRQAFHSGAREGYLQAIALMCGTEVKDIRRYVLGKGNPYPEFSHINEG